MNTDVALQHAKRLGLLALRSPLLWGSLCSLAFYLPLHGGYWSSAFVSRYFAGHWVEYWTTILFFIGLSALVIKGFDIAAQLKTADDALLDPAGPGGQSVSQAPALLDRLARQPAAMQRGYHIARLRELIGNLVRKGSADTIEEDLRYQADMDVAKMHASYALVRIVIWAVPILGFLGTVIGITEAVASLSPQQLETSLPAVTSGLGVAFDTTALSLALSMVLMFTQFVVEKYEGRLLEKVDAQCTIELMGRFETTGASNDPQVAAVRRLAETVVQSSERLVQRQTELWQSSMSVAQQHWGQSMQTSSQQIESALSGALVKGLKEHAAALLAGEKQSTELNRKHWAQVQQSLQQTVDAISAQQRELVRQGDVLLKVVDATGHVTRLETELNRNLQALAGSKHFEDTVMSLSAAIHLLNARLGATVDAPRVDLRTARPGQAA